MTTLQLPLTALTLAVSLILAAPSSRFYARTGTCTALSSCSPPPMQFVPGQLISIEVVNLTYIPLLVQHVGMTAPLSVASTQTVDVLRGSTLSPNFSLLFWTSDGGSLQASVSQPSDRTLRIEIRASRTRGHNAVYLKDNGQVQVF